MHAYGQLNEDFTLITWHGLMVVSVGLNGLFKKIFKSKRLGSGKKAKTLTEEEALMREIRGEKKKNSNRKKPNWNQNLFKSDWSH